MCSPHHSQFLERLVLFQEGLYWVLVLGRCLMPAVQARLAARVEIANTNAGTADPVVSERSKHALTI
jgi:hypothetical protein